MHRRSSIFRTRTRGRVRAVAIAALTAAMLAVGAAAAPAAAPSLPASERIAGSDRYETAALVSQRAFPDGADIAYLVTGEGFADGLSAGPAAAHEGGPVLLSRWAALPPATLAELDRLDPDTVVLLGGEWTLGMALDFELRNRYPGMS
ncbi:MAG: cell wall-binding repeat-containing protein, partial [Agrococcus sp.]